MGGLVSGLILKLRPHEQVLINGVVVENGDYKTRLRIKSDNANILRLRDAISAEEATTPLKQAYYVAQRVVAGELPAKDASVQIETVLKQSDVSASVVEDMIQRIDQCTHEGDFYCAMRALGELIRPGDERWQARPHAAKRA